MNIFHFQDAKIICLAKELESVNSMLNALGIGEKTFNVYVSRIEKRLGMSLFIRKNKTISLTAEGLELYPLCKNIIEMKNLIDPIGQTVLPEDVRGEVRLVSTQTVLEYFHLPYLVEFTKNYPKITMNISQLDDFYLIAQAVNDFYFTVDYHSDSEEFSYFPYHNFYQWLWASKSYIEQHGEPKTTDELSKHSFLFQKGNLTSKIMGGNKVKSIMPINNSEGKFFNISGCRIVDKSCELGLGIMTGSKETIRLSGLNIQRVLPEYESDALTLYVRVHKSILAKDIGKIVLNWIFECRDKALKTINIKPSYPYKRLTLSSEKGGK
jgi:DNA-binding transcriptional LysR family regulator